MVKSDFEKKRKENDDLKKEMKEVKYKGYFLLMFGIRGLLIKFFLL